jgi:serine phosphatase RsbU (regulator of sigma subunit)
VLAAAVARRRAVPDPDGELQELIGAAVPGLADVAALAVVGDDGVLRASAVACSESALASPARRALARWPERADATTGPVRVVRTGEPELVRDVGDAHLAAAARDEEQLGALRALGLRSWLIVPLYGRERPIGALTLAQASSRGSFTPDDVPVAAGLASRAALQLENARLATERAEVARTLQARLLPRALPHIPGLELAARYLPAGDATVVGGDFYDVFGNGDGTWTVLIGDVSGKGAEAAALTSLMRYTLRGAALREPSPAANLALLNDVLLTEADGARFCTALAVRLEVAEEGRARATVACGGHLPPFLLRPDGRPRRLAVHGTLLGALPEPRFAELRVPLVRGDVLLLHTDGVTDVRGAEPEEGERRLERVLARHAGRDAATIVAAVQRSAVGAQDGRPRDDIAIVGLRVV